MNKNSSISLYSGVLIALCYVACALLSFARYPLAFSPLTHWLSDLGSTAQNPAGAAFYNYGMVATALLRVPFFLGLSALRLEKNRAQPIMLLLTQAFGLLGAAAMVMIALNPIGLSSTHSFWSAVQFIATGTAFAFSVAALRYHAACPRWLLALGILTALTDMLVSMFFNTVHVLEWVIIALFLCYVVLLGLQTRRLSSVALSGAR
jgi:hypothetical membrane protein